MSTVGLRISDPVLGGYSVDTTDRMARLIGSIAGSGVIALPRSAGNYYHFCIANADIASSVSYTVGNVTVAYNLAEKTATVTSPQSWIVTYIGEF